jgi:hypothetical protein
MRFLAFLAIISLTIQTGNAQTGGVVGGSPYLKKCGNAYVGYNPGKNQLEVKASNLFLIRTESNYINLNVELRIPGEKLTNPNFVLLLFACIDNSENFNAKHTLTFRIGEKTLMYKLAGEDLHEESKSKKVGLIYYWIPFYDFREIIESKNVVIEMLNRNIEVRTNHLAILREIAQAPDKCK